MAVSPVVQSGNKEDILPLLAAVASANKVYDGTGYASLDGALIGSADSVGSLAERSYFQKAMRGRDLHYRSDAVQNHATPK